MFYNEANKDSYDSNHGVIFKNRVKDLHEVLEDIIAFYVGKGMRPIIYQSISDEGYFEEIKDVLSDYGFESWSEEQKYMILSEENRIVPNPEIVVSKVSEWQEEYASEIFEKAGEPWEIAVARKSLANENTLFFVAYAEGKPVIFVVARAEPIESPLSTEELAAYAVLHTCYTATTILNDSGAGMEVSYAADPKQHIDNQVSTLAASIVSG